MRVSAIIPVALIATPALVSGAGLLGFALGDKKADGTCKFQADYQDDFNALKDITRLVRIYAASDCNTASEILPAAEAAGFRVILGIWPDTDDSFNKDKAAVVQYAPQYSKQVYAITVGSESLYRGNFTGDQLLQKIQDVKQAVPQFKVGTADSWNKFQDGTADPLIKGNVDILLCNGFSYWQGQAINNATKSVFDDVMQAFGHIQSLSGSVDKPELWVGETGWPTDGSKYQAAVPGVDSAQTYWQTAICGLTTWGVNVFSFEAFDEPWKPKSTGQDGNVADETHWGVFNADPIIDRLPSPAVRPPPVASAQDGIIEDHTTLREDPGSPALSTTSTVEGGSSPVLPPLPAPKISERVLDLLKTPPPPSEARTHSRNSSRYFTASWGSPYPESSDASSLVTAHSRRDTFSSEASSDSPLRGLSIQTPYLRPAPIFSRTQTQPALAPLSAPHSGISAAVLVNRARRPALGLTEDWIRAHTDADLDTERLHWLSDGNDIESEGSSEGGDWFEGNLDLRTPTLKTFVERRAKPEHRPEHTRHLSNETLKQEDFEDDSLNVKMATDIDPPAVDPLGEMAIAGKSNARKLVRHSRATSSAESIGPNSSKDAFGRPGSNKDSVNLNSSVESTVTPVDDSEPHLEATFSNLDKELPPPPLEAPVEKSSEASEWRAASLPAPIKVSSEEMPNGTSPAPQSARHKKKILWNGKNITISMPFDEERGRKGKAPVPMTQKDIERMLREWEQLGYNVAGFNLGNAEAMDISEVQGQSRTGWPTAEEMQKERYAGNFRISIPDRREWDSYVEELKEAKLRALGVSLGDDDPAPKLSPATSALSRTASMQYPPLPFSPPVPTSSSTSSHALQHPNPFSPALIAGPGPSLTSQSSNVGSVASPASMHSQLYGKYNPRQSISQATGERFGSPFPYGQVPSPGVWSPQQMLYQQGLHRGGSPSLQNLGSIISPASPFSQDGYFQQADLNLQMQQRQQLLQNQLQQQMQQNAHVRQSPRFQEVREDEELETMRKSPSKTPDASQFIRHNASDSFQKEIEEAENHLEQQFQSELEGDDYSHRSEKEEHRSAIDEGFVKLLALNPSADSEGPVLHHPQPHSRGHSLSQRPYIESEDVNNPAVDLFAKPSKLNTPEIDASFSTLETSVLTNDLSDPSRQRSLSNSSNPWLDEESLPAHSDEIKREHISNPSMSKLNVAAPEFNPSKSLNVAAPEFKLDPSNEFKSTNFSLGRGAFQPATSANQSFVPVDMPLNQPVSKITGAQSSLISKINVAAPVFTPGHGDFAFSSSGPTFRPDAPAFTPKSSVADSVGNGHSSSEGLNSKKSIFSKIDLLNLGGIMKQPKKSKAIPIVRPKSTDSINPSEDEYQEDDMGHITKGDKRNKRVRGSAKEVDSVPLFATPTPEPIPAPQETSREQSPPKEHASIILTQANKENLPVEVEKDPLRVLPTAATNALRPNSKFENSPDYDGKGWAPWEFERQQQIQDFSTASAYPVQSPAPYESKGQNGHVDKEKEEEPRSTISTASSPLAEKPHQTKNSLSALAKPFEFTTPSWLKFGSSNSAAKQVAAPAPAPAPVSSGGLSSSRYAADSPPPVAAEDVESPEISLDTEEKAVFQASLPRPQSPPYNKETEVLGDHEPTFEEIDAVMRHMNETESQRTISRDADTPRWHQPSPSQPIQMPLDSSSPIRLPPQDLLRSDAPSPSPRRFQPLPGELPGQRVFSRVHDDPFIAESLIGMAYESPVHNLNRQGDLPASDWDRDLSESEDAKFQARTQFFDNHVNDLVGGLLAERLEPLEKTLEGIQLSLATITERNISGRRTRRSFSGELPESDADDEDEEGGRSVSPRKDRKMEKIRSIVSEALAAHVPVATPQSSSTTIQESSQLLQALQEMRDQFGQSMRLDLRGEDLRNIVEEAVERRMPTPSKDIKENTSNAKVAELEEKILGLMRKAEGAERKMEEEISTRRAAEDRLAEVQRLLRISSEEETRLRETVDEKDQKLKSIDDTRSKSTMRTALLEADAQNAKKNHNDMANKLNAMESELKQARQDSQKWQIEAEKAFEASKRYSGDAELANETNAQLRRTIQSLKIQMEESLRVRDSMRAKLGSLQENMARAAQEISQENAKRAKREQELVARQEVLDARLQAEARTRERLEREIERLERGEREGMRAVNESKRLEELLAAIRTELHETEKKAMRHQREFEEARESGLSEVQRTTHYMQAEIEHANNQVNIVRQDLEDQVVRLRGELDHIKLETDTSKARSEMLLEEAVETKRKDIDSLTQKHTDEIEDLQTRQERDLSNAIENHQRSEQHLLERLSLSSAKTEHLQDRVTHLEEKLEIAQTAAAAAAQAARSAGVSSPEAIKAARKPTMELPEKISPQALRESIMVLQEQLQDREQTIELLEQQLSTVDLDAPSKITKLEDEISWLRELIAVRVGDLQDLIKNASEDDFDAAAIKDAAIRLKANLQMEMQVRERAMSGASILPNIASSIREAATPRVAQVVGPMAAAWGSWRKSQAQAQAQETGSTPSKSSPQSFLSGLLTPPASSARTPTTQPTAFNTTGRRLTAQKLASRPSRRQEKMPAKDAPPSTPPMMRKASYDSDARAEDFSDAGFYDDDESAVDDSMFGAGRL